MVLTLFVGLFLILILAELVKGLSANGTPPVLQKLPGQLHLAHFMWSRIQVLRGLFVAGLIACVVSAPLGVQFIMMGAAIPLGLIWGGVYWFFTKVWTGRVKFPPITSTVFVGRDENTVPSHINVIGIDIPEFYQASKSRSRIGRAAAKASRNRQLFLQPNMYLGL